MVHNSHIYGTYEENYVDICALTLLYTEDMKKKDSYIPETPGATMSGISSG